MTEHVHEHEWRLGEWLFRPTLEEMNNLYAICVGENCTEILPRDDIERRLNATERLPAHVAAGAWVIAGDDFSELRDYAAALEDE